MSGGGPARRRLGQVVAGLVALPLSTLPFVAYVSWTPEGRLVRAELTTTLAPPTLPTLSAHQSAEARELVPEYANGVMALTYHGLGSGGEATDDEEPGFVLSPQRFGEHLAALQAAGMHAVTASQVAEAFAGGEPLPPKAVMITFDDGRTDAMLYADPLLEQAGMAATTFVVTGAAEEPGIYYAGWEEIEAYAASGRWDIQSHTADAHRRQHTEGGGQLPALTSLAVGEDLDDYRARIRADLARASAAVEEHVGRRPVAFAYPYGAHGADRTNHPEIARILEEELARHHELAFHQDDQDELTLVTCDQDPFDLRRLSVGDWSGPELLRRVQGAITRSTPTTPTSTCPPPPGS